MPDKARVPIIMQHADSFPDERTMEHWLHVLHDLLELKLLNDPHPIRYAPINQESIIDLYRELFQWGSEHEDDSLTGLISNFLGFDHPLMEKYAQLRTRMEMGIRQKLEFEAMANDGDSHYVR